MIFTAGLVFAASWALPTANAHIGIFGPGMFCRDGPQTKENLNSNTVVNPLYNLKFNDYFFGHGVTNGKSNQCYNWPPPKGEFLEIPAGGSFPVNFANNRAFSPLHPEPQLGNFPDGENHPEYDDPKYYNPKCVPSPLLHTENRGDVAGSAFGIAYVSEYSQLRQDNIVIFSTNFGTPWHSKARFQVPADMPACPPDGCLCTWGWVPNGCGQSNSYLQLFRCKVTGAKPNAPALAAPKAPVWCEQDPSKCVKGAKQMIYWHQAERNNINTDFGTGLAGEQKDGKQRSPGYNAKLGWFVDGAQNDIFVTPSPRASSASSVKPSSSTVVKPSSTVIVKPTSTKATSSVPKPTSTKTSVKPTSTSTSTKPTSTKTSVKPTSTKKTSSVKTSSTKKVAATPKAAPVKISSAKPACSGKAKPKPKPKPKPHHKGSHKGSHKKHHHNGRPVHHNRDTFE